MVLAGTTFGAVTVVLNDAAVPRVLQAEPLYASLFSTYHLVRLDGLLQSGVRRSMTASGTAIETYTFDVETIDARDTTPPSAPTNTVLTTRYDEGNTCFIDPGWEVRAEFTAAEDDFGILYYLMIDRAGVIVDALVPQDGFPALLSTRTEPDPAPECYRVVAVDVAGQRTEGTQVCVNFITNETTSNATFDDSDDVGCVCTRGRRSAAAVGLLAMGVLGLAWFRRRR